MRAYEKQRDDYIKGIIRLETSIVCSLQYLHTQLLRGWAAEQKQQKDAEPKKSGNKCQKWKEKLLLSSLLVFFHVGQVFLDTGTKA